MSTHTCEVVPVELEPHPNADRLSIVKVWGYQVVVRTDEWEGKDIGVYIPPDSVCPNDKRFGFLYDDAMQSSKKAPGRVRVRKFRKVISQGLLVPAPPGAYVGQDFMKKWGIEHYVSAVEKQAEMTLGWWDRFLDWLLVKILKRKKLRRRRRLQPDWDQPAGGPNLYSSKYDVENFRRYNKAIEPGELVYVTEKIHGCNARYVWHDGQMYCGSRTQWKKKHAANTWWKALEQNPWIEDWCISHPGMILYGEVFGQVQDLKYDTKPGELRFLVFDVLDSGQWLNWGALSLLVAPEHRVPVLQVGRFDPELAAQFAEEQSSIASHCREGVVICTQEEKEVRGLGRAQVKIVGNRYLERGK